MKGLADKVTLIPQTRSHRLLFQLILIIWALVSLLSYQVALEVARFSNEQVTIIAWVLGTMTLIGVSVLKRRDLFHPGVLGTAAIYLYGYWFSVFSVFLGLNVSDAEVNAVGLGLLALTAFAGFNVLLPVRRPTWRVGVWTNHIQARAVQVKVIRIVSFALVPIALGLVFGVGSSGAMGKFDISVPGWVTYVLQVTSVLLVLWLVIDGWIDKFDAWPFVLTGAFALATLLFLGERNYVFTGLVAMVFSFYWPRMRIGGGKVLLALCLGLSLVPALHGMKGLMVYGGNGVLAQYGAISALRGQEFGAAGRNLIFLIERTQPGSVPGTLWNDVQRTLYMADHSSTAQFNQDWGLAGRGFTLIGQAWLMWGEAGVVLMFGLFAVALGTLYRSASHGPYWATCYIIGLLAFIYVQRADVANWLGMTIKAGLLVVLLLNVAFRLASAQVTKGRSRESYNPVASV